MICLPQDLRERRGNRIVVRRAALEENHLADLAPAHHAVQVVERHRIRQARADSPTSAPLCISPVTSRSMNTVQRSPRRAGMRGRQRQLAQTPP